MSISVIVEKVEGGIQAADGPFFLVYILSVSSVYASWMRMQKVSKVATLEIFIYQYQLHSATRTESTCFFQHLLATTIIL